MQSERNAFIACDGEYKESKIVIFGAPFDSTASYRPGARFGPDVIRRESYGIETYSPYQNNDMADHVYFDAGNTELPIGSSEMALDSITDVTRELIEDGKLPFMLGGEHLVTLGAVRAFMEYYDDLYIIQFDAHADLRDDYLGVRNSHACVMRRCFEFVGDGRIYQYGIRSGEREEFAFAAEHTNMNLFNLNGIDAMIKKIGAAPVYLTIDMDVLDPSEFPGTGTPEAGGVRYTELLPALMKLRKLNIVGADMTEFSPPYDPSGISAALCCKLLRELLLMLS